MSYFEFPHTRNYDGDLGYIIKKLDELNTRYNNFFEYNSIRFHDPVTWDISTVYSAWNIVYDEQSETLYISKTAVPAGIDITNNDYWSPVSPFKVDIELDTESFNPVANKTITNRLNTLSVLFNEMNDRLAAEIETRGEESTTINSRIDNTISDLNSEIVNRVDADNTINARIDEIIALTPGSTTGDAELADIRTWFNGNSSATAGDAVRGQASLLDDIIGSYNSYSCPHKASIPTTYNVTVTTISTDVFSYVGTANSNGWINIIDTGTSGLPKYFKAGQKIYICFEATDTTDLLMQIWTKPTTDGEFTRLATLSPKSGFQEVTLPDVCTGILCRTSVINGTAYNSIIRLSVLNRSLEFASDNAVLKDFIMKSDTTTGLPSCDLNEVLDNGYYLLIDSNTYTNKPDGFPNIGFLNVIYSGSWHLQLLYQFTGGKIFKRRGNGDGTTWEDWREISGGGINYNITNEYSFPEYSQTLSVTASPTITTDTNNYLASSGDTTDRTADILSLLSTTGVCNLGPGVFYVEDLIMPEGSTITGCGYNTVVRLADSGNFAIKMNSYCKVSNLRIKGAESAPVMDSTIGTRHGILWQGTYTDDSSTIYRGMIDNLYIDNFSGGGITCYDTGYGTSSGLEATNIYITNCWAGLNIAYWSEFHKFTNIRAGQCYIGCVNNGGNNIFTNCDFSSNLEFAFLIDNSQGQSPNNAHGSCVGCVFNHTAHGGVANTGTGIKILNTRSGFIFSACQIYYSKIELEDADGIVFDSCNMGNTNCDVSITNGHTTVFNNCMVEGDIPKTITNNLYVFFNSCYNKRTGAPWSN